MKNCLLFFSLFLLSISTYAQAKVFANAVEYNDYIVSEQNKIGEAIQVFTGSWTDNTFTGQPEKHKESVENKRMGLVRQCAESIKNVTALQAFKGNTELRNATAELFKFYLACAEKEYKRLAELLFFKGDAEAELESMLNSITAKEDALDKVFQKAQSEFAKSNGFVLN